MSKKIKLFSLSFIAIVPVALVGFWVLYPKNNEQFTSVLSEIDTSINIYYPKNLPEGYALDKNTISKSDTLLTYAISNGTNNVFISMQQKPRDSVITNFETVQLTAPELLNSSLGSGVIGIANSQTIASVVTDTTWILITGSKGVTANAVKTVTESLEPLN